MRSIQLAIWSFAFTFFAVYTVVWGILEPIPFKDDKTIFRLYFIIAFSFVVAVISLLKRGLFGHIFYRFIRPFFQHKLQTLSTRLKDDSLSEGWHQINWSTNQGNPMAPMRPDIVDDFLFNKVCLFHDSKTHDATHGIKIIAKEKGTALNYFLKPLSENSTETPVIYLRVALRDISVEEKEKNVYRWLTLVIDKIHRAETSKHSEEEETVYIKSNGSFMDWMFFAVDVKEKVNRIQRWRDKYAFNSIEAIKVRGAFELASLEITK